MRIRTWLFPALAVCLLILASCSMPLLGGVTERSPEPGAASLKPVPPQGDEVPTGELECMLYYRYKQEGLLAATTARLRPTPSISIEQAIVERLIQGPGEGRYDLTASIHPQTRVLSVRENNGYLSITLSEEFLMVPGTTGAWEMPEGTYVDQTLINRQMAVYSIVNSITELGVHSQVMIQVAENTSGSSARIKRQQAGFSSSREQPINPLTRDTSLIYTAERSLRYALDALVGRDWETLSAYIAVRDVDGEAAPTRELLPEQFGSLALIGYSLHEERTQTPDGTQTTICVDCTFRETTSSTTRTVAYESVPLRLVRDTDIWRVAYPSLRALIPG